MAYRLTPDHIFSDAQNCEIAADIVTGQIREGVIQTARRIGSRVISGKFSSTNQYTAIDMYRPVNTVPFEEFWVTDRPEKVFPTTPIYTVTSSLALESPLEDDVLLWSPIDHSGEEIHTHRGLGLRVFSNFMRGLGIRLGRKDECLWFGSQVDGEQFKIEDEIAQAGPAIDEEVISTFFNVSTVDDFMNDPSCKLHSQLVRVIQSAVERQPSVYQSDPECRAYINRLLDTMHRTMGVREGWFTVLEEILKQSRESKIPTGFNLAQFERSLIKAVREGLPIPKSSQAIVLEVDSREIFRHMPIFVFPLSTRPPDTIIPAPLLPASAVTAVYTEHGLPDSTPERFRYLQKPLAQLSIEKWLTNSVGEHITPQRARSSTVNPTAPLCALRYAQSPAAVWAKHIAAGDIAPWWEAIFPLISPANITDQVLGELVLMRARESGMLDKLQSVAKDKETIGQQFLQNATCNAILPCVKGVNDLEGVMLPSYYS
jgi:hypothetical protein